MDTRSLRWNYMIVANKYMQYLANEYISSFYREMVRKSSYSTKNANEKNKEPWIDYLHLYRVLNYLRRMGFEKNEDDTELSTVIYVPNDGYKNTHSIVGEQETRITVHTQSFTDDRVIWTRKEGLTKSSISYIY